MLHKDPVQCSYCVNIFAFNVSEEPWNVEDLLDEDGIADKVPLEKLQLLGSDLIESSVFNNDPTVQFIRVVISSSFF